MRKFIIFLGLLAVIISLGVILTFIGIIYYGVIYSVVGYTAYKVVTSVYTLFTKTDFEIEQDMLDL